MSWTPNDIAPFSLGDGFAAAPAAGAWVPHDSTLYSDTFAAAPAAWALPMWTVGFFAGAEEGGGATPSSAAKSVLLVGV